MAIVNDQDDGKYVEKLANAYVTILFDSTFLGCL